MESSRKARGFDVSALQAKNGLDRQQMKSAANGTGCHLESYGGPKSSRVSSGPWPRSISNVPGWVGAVRFSVILLVFLIPLCMSSPAISQMTPDMKEALELHKAGKVKEALDLYSDVIKKNPRSAEAFNWRGMAYDDLGQLDKALADYNKAIELNPDYADAYNNRGEIYRKQKKYAEALVNYKKAAQLEKGFAEAHYNIALILELQKQNDQAAAQYGLYLRLRPNAPDKQQVAAKIQMLRKAMAQARVAGQPPAPGQPAAPGEPPTGPRPPALAQVKPGAKPALPKFGPPGMPGVPTPPNIDLGIPGVPPLPIPTDINKLAAQFNTASTIVTGLWYIFLAVMLYLIATKTGTSLAWLAFIPIANIILMVKIARKPMWWLVLLFLPVVTPLLALVAFADPTGGIIVGVLAVAIVLVTIVAWLLLSIGIARARRKSVIWGILLFIPCTNPIALAYLGLSR